MKYRIENNWVVVSGPEKFLNEINKLYSYRDKSAEMKLKRFEFLAQARLRMYNNIKPKWWEAWYEKELSELKQKLIRYGCKQSEDNLLVPIGLLEDFKGQLRKRKIVARGFDARDHNLDTRKLRGYQRTLRRPQEEALEIMKKNPLGLIRMATGVGKTDIGQEIIRHYGVPSLFLVPSKRILKQTIERFEEAFGRKNIGTYGGGKKKHGYITVATYQSVFTCKNPKEFEQYKLAIFDEVHHIAAETFYEVGLNKLPGLIYRYGLTADEERADGGTILVHAAVGPVIYSYEADEAIRDKYLAKPYFTIYDITTTKGTYIHWKTDYKTQKRERLGTLISEPYDGDSHHEAYKNWVLGNDELTHMIAEMAKGLAIGGKSTLILIDEKEHGDKFMKFLENASAAFVYGGCSDNDRNIDLFNKRRLSIIVATSVIGEGADMVPVDYLFNLMGGTRPKQVNGRALRNDPDENGVPRKPTCSIIDFDFSKSPVLNRHSILRQAVHKTYVGIIHDRRKLL